MFINIMHIKKNITRIFTAYIGVILILIFVPNIVCAFPYKGLDIKIQGTILEMYDDNIRFAHEDKEADFITSLVLGLGVTYEGRRRNLSFTSNINRSLHYKFSDIKSSSENLTLNFKNEFSERDRLSLKDTFSHTHTAVSFEEEFLTTRGRSERFNNSFNLNYSRDISEHFTAIARYTNWLNKITEVEGDQSDSYANKAGLELDYLYSVATTFLVSYAFATTSYKNSGNNSTHTIATGMRKYLTRRLYLDGKVGIDFITSINNKKTVKNAIEVSLTDEIDENTVAKLAFMRRDSTTSDTGDIFSNWRITGSLKKQLSERFNSSFSGFYGQGKTVSAGITNKLLGASGAISYEFTEHLAGDFSYAYSIFDSSDETGGYNRSTASIGLTTVF